MKLSVIATVLAACVPMPLFAQIAAPKTTSAAAADAPMPVDPIRLAAARPVIDRIWPLGTYARLMHGAMDQVMHSTMSSMYDMRVDDFAKGSGGTTAKEQAALKGKTIGDVMAAADPAYKERMKRTMDVMMSEMTRIMSDIEPDVRDAMARAYARRFTADQLGELDRFFVTPTGAMYANESMMLMMGPDMMQAMQAFAPRLMREMPAIMSKVESATRDLPPLGKRNQKQ